MDESIRYWLALLSLEGIGAALAGRLVRRFTSPRQVFSASTDALVSVSGISNRIAANISGFSQWEKIDGELEKAGRLGIDIVSREDSRYPRNLLNIPSPPPLLYIKGEFAAEDELALAIVGSRSASRYGIEAARKFSERLVKGGVTIISGMARGVDTIAHLAALEGEGRTIAVLGCGLDVIYPPENRKLFERIAQKGAIISEFPLGTVPDAVNFPRRNRIISGLSLGVIVVEASLKSGSLITARYAIEQGRDVYAIPGNINSSGSKGTNRLIKDGAKLVDAPEEVLADILPQYMPSAPERAKKERQFEMSDEERQLFDIIDGEPLHIDDLAGKSGLDMAQLSSSLLSLELMGAVTQHPGKNFTRSIL
ncbi:MAG: DNA-protecting protein DprA [Proteobacteria bacterium]|nr:DNA-protecting protein DprA [Pseudomonadota bacterium]